jgi:hypothetical protein
VPLALPIVPVGLHNLMVELDMSHAIVLGHHFLPVAVDLFGGCIKL